MAFKAHLAPAQSSNSQEQSHGASIDPRRQARRALRLETSGVLPGGIEANVVIHNVSAVGLLIETDLALNVGEVLAVDMPDIGPVGAEIVWESGHLFGCAFQQSLGESALAAAQLRGGPVVHDKGAPTNIVDHRATIAHRPIVSDPFGVRLNRLRLEKGLTLAQVAAELGVSKPTVWAWEKGKARPLPERMEAIAHVLGVDEGDLNVGTPNNHNSALVEECRMRIATKYGTEPSNVRIMIEV
ncbi:MAG: helix-turn-helix transcriptional regulator [Erythrobacter sp.]